MLKRALAIILTISLLIGFAGCQNKSSASADGNTEGPAAVTGSVAVKSDADRITGTIEMNIGSCWTTSTFPPNVGVVALKERIESLSDGKIAVTLHLGTIGAERELLESVQIQSVEGIAVTTGPLGGFIPLAEIFMIPYLFNDWGHAYAAVDGALGDRLEELANEKNMHILGWWTCDTRNIVGKGTPVVKPDDLKGKKIRLMESKFLTMAYEHYGAIATPMSFSETFTALQQGAIDGEQTTSAVIGSGYGDICDYITQTDEIYQLVPIIVNLDWWNSLPQEAKNIISQAAVEVEVAQRQLGTKMYPGYMKKWEDAGLTVQQGDREAFKAKTQEIYPKYEQELKDDEGWMQWVMDIGEQYPFVFSQADQVPIGW